MTESAARILEAGALAPLPRSFYERPTTTVARALLGKLLVRRRGDHLAVARLVEVEAYLGIRDAASHARRGPTPRAAIMFGPPGFLYVYLIYGMHHCMNVVTETDGVAGAVLLRAAEPVLGVPLEKPRPLTGPGKLCAGLGITRRDNGRDLSAVPTANDPDVFFLADDGSRPPRRASSARIGVEYAGVWAERQLRFYVPGNRYVRKGP